MTNREWLNSLSNEDFIKWLYNHEEPTPYEYEGNTFYKCEQPTPKLETIARGSTHTRMALKKWLDEERKDDND